MDVPDGLYLHPHPLRKGFGVVDALTNEKSGRSVALRGGGIQVVGGSLRRPWGTPSLPEASPPLEQGFSSDPRGSALFSAVLSVPRGRPLGCGASEVRPQGRPEDSLRCPPRFPGEETPQ
ncbi:MAG: hypothetical protein V1915_03615 [Candidatus Bathyarchaeota archaeon]